jgi:dipeptidyl aminopeptidase/acylaminoacyl peptidase
MLIQAGVIGGSSLNSRSQVREDFRVHSVNILTGEAELLDEVGSRGTFDWWADNKGKVRLRRDAVAGQDVLYARLDGSNDWTEVHRQTLYAFEAAKESSGSTSGIMDVIGFAPDPNQLYVFYWPGDRQAIGLFDLRTRQITQVFSDPKYDVDGAVAIARQIVGARVSRAMPEQVFFDARLKSAQATVAATYPGHSVAIVSASDDLSKLALVIEGPKSVGGAYILVDLKESAATTIAARYPTLDAASTGEQKYITYTARDGTKIDAYLTVPRSGGKNLPAIVLPHGGPEARDEGGFDWLSQFFASRGYVVLQPQFRGSTGFGTQFALAGRRQWGAKMQDDVSDGVKYMTSSGIADPAKVCIMGWSYGGYAAMAGATLTPELYRCAIAGAGVSDLIEMLVYEAKYGGGAARYWRKHIGDPVADKASIDAVSPIKHVANMKAPMLLIHGELDQVVPIKQSEIMADALKAAGKPYEFVRLADENHNISFASTRIKTLKAMDAFLAKYNPAR